ncbi:hypothetical protein BC826DRAFT_1107427 [Russula brevipes]|nr:hypothetical protein BC826DRAFT_1107427 [Russula brevipes]
MGPRSHAQKRQVSAVTPSVAPSLPDISGSSVPTTSGPSQELVIRGHSVRLKRKTGRRRVTIDILPDDVLLEIFDVDTMNQGTQRWHILVHVCRRWRSVVFASTRRLNLQLRCTYKTPVRKTLDVWPALPIIIGDCDRRVPRAKGADNVVAALEHHDRVCHIDLWNTPKSDLNRFAAAMRDPFPKLTHLDLRTIKKSTVLVLPNSFLGGSAPRLQTLALHRISFPAIPRLLSSAIDLVTLDLHNIPHSGYISPEALATSLSELTRLERLSIGFLSPRSHPGTGQPSPPRSIRTILPALKVFVFRGVSEYLEDLTSRIDAPLLSYLHITFFTQLIFNTPRLCAFISHAKNLRSQSQAHMTFRRGAVELFRMTPGHLGLKLTILCKASDWQLSSLVQVCDSPFLSLFNLERLKIYEYPYLPRHWLDDVENVQWLELLHPFTTLKSLSLSEVFTPRVVPALQGLSGEGIMEVLPALQSISLPESSLSGPVENALAQFLTARQLSSRPVTVNPQGQE